jgi:hypothetical protein
MSQKKAIVTQIPRVGISFLFLYEVLHCGDNFWGILLKCKFEKIAKFRKT